MKIRFVAAGFSLCGLALLAASPDALAQRFLGDLVGPMMSGGWSMHQHAGGPMPSLPAERVGDYKTLAGNLSKKLPKGTDVRAAATGFRNLGDFVAAVHVSNNLKIPFADVKARMMNGGNLGTAIAALRPELDSQIEARKARADAYEELRRA